LSKNESKGKQENANIKGNFFNKIRDIHIQIVLALAAMMLVVIAFCQYRAGIDSIKTTNRAYLRVSPIFKKHYTSDSEGEFIVIVKPENYGRTPPEDVHIVAYLVLADSSYAENHVKGDTLAYRSRDSYGEIKLEYKEEPFPRDPLVEKAVLTFYLSGEITYNDLFKESHSSKFCLRYNWQYKYFEEYDDCNYFD
jgi:hypothetical protein